MDWSLNFQFIWRLFYKWMIGTIYTHYLPLVSPSCFSRLITIMLQSKQQSKQWKRAESFPPKKAKPVLLANKVITSVFWDSKDIILVDYLEKGKTVNSVYYCTLLHRWSEEINEKHPGILRMEILFHQDNARVYISIQLMANIDNSGFELQLFTLFIPLIWPRLNFIFSRIVRNTWERCNSHKMNMFKLQSMSILRAKKNIFLKQVL